MIFASSGPVADAAVSDMKELTDFYKSEEWLLDIPYGGQEKLFWDFWPGCNSLTVERRIYPGHNRA